MNISKVAKATGLTAKTIRYYESIGLITAPVRSDNGYRSYTEGALLHRPCAGRRQGRVRFPLHRAPRRPAVGHPRRRTVPAHQRCPDPG